MKRKITYLPTEPVESLITFVRGQKVILDSDLARIYSVQTKALNQAMKRNAERFPADFVFQLTEQERREVAASRSQNAALEQSSESAQPVGIEVHAPNWSQFVTSSRKHRGVSYLPYAFTEHGAIMAASVLNSPQAVRMSVFVVRAFVKMREVLAQNQTLADKLAGLEAKLASRIDGHEKVIILILRELRELMNPPPQPTTPREKIGFSVKERGARYRVRR
jgi:L-lactate utilization protein LutC